MRHRSKGRETAFQREHDIAGPDELLADLGFQRRHNLVLPCMRETAARTVVGDPKRRIGNTVDNFDFGREPAPAFVEVRRCDRVAKVDLGHDRQNGHLEHDRVQPRAFDRDVDLFGACDAGHFNEPLVELKEPQQVDEVALEKTPVAKVIELAPVESERAELPNFVLDLADVRRQRNVGIATFEPVLDFRARKMMQYDLHHRELVKIGIEKRLDDHCKMAAPRRASLLLGTG